MTDYYIYPGDRVALRDEEYRMGTVVGLLPDGDVLVDLYDEPPASTKQHYVVPRSHIAAILERDDRTRAASVRCRAKGEPVRVR